MTRHRLAVDVLKARLESGEVLLNPRTGMYHALNPTGVVLLDLLAGGHDFEQAVQTLAERFGRPPREVQRDAQEFVSQMTERGLLVELTEQEE